MFAAIHGVFTERSALANVRTANTKPRQGFATPAHAALDPARRLPEDDSYEREALSRIAQTRDSLLSLWSDFRARLTGSGGS